MTDRNPRQFSNQEPEQGKQTLYSIFLKIGRQGTDWFAYAKSEPQRCSCAALTNHRGPQPARRFANRWLRCARAVGPCGCEVDLASETTGAGLLVGSANPASRVTRL
jgi:hypothetical protein